MTSQEIVKVFEELQKLYQSFDVNVQFKCGKVMKNEMPVTVQINGKSYSGIVVMDEISHLTTFIAAIAESVSEEFNKSPK